MTNDELIASIKAMGRGTRQPPGRDSSTETTDPRDVSLSLRQASLGAGMHLALAAYAVWTSRGRVHRLVRHSLTVLAAIFVIQAVAALSRNERLIEYTYERSLARIERICSAGLVAGTLAERRGWLAGALTLAGFLVSPGRNGALAKTAGRLLFFGS